MRNRNLAAFTALLIVAGLIAAVPAAAQAPAGGKATRPSTVKAAAAKKWRTPWGDPDLQGSWSNTNITPLERPAKYAGRESMTEQERAEEEKKRARAEGGGGGFYDSSWTDGRTSLIYDPTDGKMPASTPEGQKRQARLKASFERARNNGPYNGPEDMEIRTRCIIRDALPRIPATYGNSYEIVQGPGSVAIFHETIHETRIIPLDGRPHVGAAVRELMGDARGHFDGDTLVVETTNFTNRTHFGYNNRYNSEKLRLVERFTPTAAGKLNWEVTVNDPDVWTRPWTFAMTLTKDDSQPVFEYACHEGNYGLRHILQGARAED